MSTVRQYIGARYVTKIYENSLDPSSAEWEASVNYEPLTMVTYNNGSYLSKKDVPGSVGNPADNPSYWVQTGFYNGQIASLQDQIDDMKDGTVSGSLQNQINDMNDGSVEGSLQDQINDLSDEVTHLSDRKYIFIGDSYQYGTGNNGTSWLDYLAGYMGWSENVDYYHDENGGYGFTPSGATFLSLLQGLENSISDKDSITDIIVTGGLNEWGTYTALPTAIAAFCTYAKATYPNAKISVGYLGNLKYHAERKFLLRLVLDYYMNSMTWGADAYIAGCENLCHDYSYYANDDWHPDEYGHKEIARGIMNYINGSSIDVQTPYSSATFTLDSYFDSGSITVNESRLNDIAVLKNQLLATFTRSDAPTIYNNRAFTLGIVNPKFICGIYQSLLRVSVSVYIGASGSFETLPAYIQLTADTNELKLILCGDGSAITFDTIIIPPFELTAPTFLS